MHQRDVRQSDDNKVGVMSKIMDFNNKKGNLILELQGHHSSMALENTIVVTANVHQFSNNFF